MLKAERTRESCSKSETYPGSDEQIKIEKLEDGEFRNDKLIGSEFEDKEFHQKILEFAKSYAYKDLQKGKRPKKLASLIVEKFSKPIDQTKSVWLMERLVSASKSVGHIYAEGCPGGTCFIVRKNVILTNYHVFNQIRNYIAKFKDRSLKVFVSFDHLHPNQKNLDEVEVDINRIHAENEKESLDYIFLELRNASDQPALDEEISIDNPEDLTSDTVTVIGHPNDGEKK